MGHVGDNNSDGRGDELSVLLQVVKVIMGQYGAVLAGTWWYLVSVGCYWLVLGGTGSV